MFWRKKIGSYNPPRKKVGIAIGNIDLFAYYIVQKIVKCYRVNDLFKMNQIDIPDY